MNHRRLLALLMVASLLLSMSVTAFAVDADEEQGGFSAGETTDSAPAEDTTTDSAPAENTTTDSAPAEDTTTDNTPAEDTTTNSTPAEDTTTNSTPAEDTTTDSAPAEDTTTDNTPAEDTTTDSAPAENTAPSTDSAPTDALPDASGPSGDVFADDPAAPGQTAPETQPETPAAEETPAEPEPDDRSLLEKAADAVLDVIEGAIGAVNENIVSPVKQALGLETEEEKAAREAKEAAEAEAKRLAEEEAARLAAEEAERQRLAELERQRQLELERLAALAAQGWPTVEDGEWGFRRTVTNHAGERYVISAKVQPGTFPEEGNFYARYVTWDDLTPEQQNALLADDANFDPDSVELLDIGFTNGGGNEMQPRVPVDISISIDTSNVTEDTTIEIKHVKEHETNTDVAPDEAVEVTEIAPVVEPVATVEVAAEETTAIATATAESFSIFAITISKSGDLKKVETTRTSGVISMLYEGNVIYPSTYVAGDDYTISFDSIGSVGTDATNNKTGSQNITIRKNQGFYKDKMTPEVIIWGKTSTGEQHELARQKIQFVSPDDEEENFRIPDITFEAPSGFTSFGIYGHFIGMIEGYYGNTSNDSYLKTYTHNGTSYKFYEFDDNKFAITVGDGTTASGWYTVAYTQPTVSVSPASQTISTADAPVSITWTDLGDNYRVSSIISSNSGVATVNITEENNEITEASVEGIAAGTATITVTLTNGTNSYSGTAKVTVKGLDITAPNETTIRGYYNNSRPSISRNSDYATLTLSNKTATVSANGNYQLGTVDWYYSTNSGVKQQSGTLNSFPVTATSETYVVVVATILDSNNDGIGSFTDWILYTP